MTWRPGTRGREVARFIVVGCINTGVDIVVLQLLLLLFRVGASTAGFSLCKAISFGCGIVSSYVLNSRWTFAARRSRLDTGASFLFVGITLASAALNTVVATTAFHLLAEPLSAVTYRAAVAAVFGACASMAANYLGYSSLVFRSRAGAGGESARGTQRKTRNPSPDGGDAAGETHQREGT